MVRDLVLIPRLGGGGAELLLVILSNEICRTNYWRGRLDCQWNFTLLIKAFAKHCENFKKTRLPFITIVFTPYCVASEIVGEENGLIVSTNDADRLTNAIKVILSDLEK